jgi:hypothetical protein
MRDDPLPADLAALERELSARGGAEPAGLRRRVLAAVGDELAARPRRWTWRLALGAAAALLWVNLSMSVTSNLGRPGGGRLDDDRLQKAARQVQELVPGLPEAEVYRQALLALAGPRLAPAPAPLPSPYRVQRRKDWHTWDTP